MSKTIQQSVSFAAPASELFQIYMSSAKHAAATGGAAKIGRKVGQSFTAHDGYIKGKNLAIVPKRLVVQSWRGADWSKKTPDSLLVLVFSDTASGGRIDIVHTNVPGDRAKSLDDGWHEYYWRPWKAYLKKRPR